MRCCRMYLFVEASPNRPACLAVYKECDWRTRLKPTERNHVSKADVEESATTSAAFVTRTPRQQTHQKAARDSFQLGSTYWTFKRLHISFPVADLRSLKCTSRRLENYRSGYEMNISPEQLSHPCSQTALGPVALRLQIPLHLPMGINIAGILLPMIKILRTICNSCRHIWQPTLCDCLP